MGTAVPMANFINWPDFGGFGAGSPENPSKNGAGEAGREAGPNTLDNEGRPPIIVLTTRMFKIIKLINSGD